MKAMPILRRRAVSWIGTLLILLQTVASSAPSFGGGAPAGTTGSGGRAGCCACRESKSVERPACCRAGPAAPVSRSTAPSAPAQRPAGSLDDLLATLHSFSPAGTLFPPGLAVRFSSPVFSRPAVVALTERYCTRLI